MPKVWPDGMFAKPWPCGFCGKEQEPSPPQDRRWMVSPMLGRVCVCEECGTERRREAKKLAQRRYRARKLQKCHTNA